MTVGLFPLPVQGSAFALIAAGGLVQPEPSGSAGPRRGSHGYRARLAQGGSVLFGEGEILKEALEIATGPKKHLLRSLSLPKGTSR